MLRHDHVLLLTAGLMLVIGTGVSLRRDRLPPEAIGPVLTDAVVTSPHAPWIGRSLEPVTNPDLNAPVQPARCRPYHVVTTQDGSKAYVTLAGKEIQPGNQVVVLDVAKRTELKRITVGSQPCGLALHPNGRWLVVTNRFSNYLSVIDVTTDEVVSEIPILFYCEDLVFAPDGHIAYVTNFWKDQVLVVDLDIDADRLTGQMRTLGFDREQFFGRTSAESVRWAVCDACGWREEIDTDHCRRCGHGPVQQVNMVRHSRDSVGLSAILRAGCGASECHLYRSGGFYAGPDLEEMFRSVTVHSFPGDPDASPLLLAATSHHDGGWADGLDGRHHTGGTVFEDPKNNPDYVRLHEWIANGFEGPGIPVGQKPRDLAITPDGKTLFVANTGSADVSVVDLTELRQTRRIYTRSAINDVLTIDGRLVLASLGAGSGHPKAHHPGRESEDPNHPEAEFTLFRDVETGRPLPLSEQFPLGPFDNVDGTAQEKFRDITNDIILLDPVVDNVARYQASEQYTRYTSDTFEALPGDKKGDVAAELMKVVGAFPEQIAQIGDKLYVTMSGTFEVQEWHVDLNAKPASRLVPGRVFPTGLKPTGIAIAGNRLVVTNHLDESVTFIDLETRQTSQLSLSRLPDPFPANDFERGELFVQTSVYSADQDQSCVHCHYRDTSDGRRWSVSQVMGQTRDGRERTGGSREVPDIRNLVDEVPFFVEGTLSMDEALTMMMEHNPLVDFQGQTPAGDFSDIYASDDELEKYAKSADAVIVATGKGWKNSQTKLADLIKRREIHFARISKKYLGHGYSFREFQQFIGAYQGGEPRLLPSPVDESDMMVRHGKSLFEDPKVGCFACHPAPTFTDKKHVYNQNKSFPPLVSTAQRDNIHTLISADRIDFFNGYSRSWDNEDEGRVEEREGYFVAPSLRGLWARPAKFLHHGHAVSLREILCTPDHHALRRFSLARKDTNRPGRWEQGLNELDGLPDTHGTTSHLSIWDIECLAQYINSIE